MLYLPGVNLPLYRLAPLPPRTLISPVDLTSTARTLPAAEAEADSPAATAVSSDPPPPKFLVSSAPPPPKPKLEPPRPLLLVPDAGPSSLLAAPRLPLQHAGAESRLPLRALLWHLRRPVSHLVLPLAQLVH
jgi:hypothetical protein